MILGLGSDIIENERIREVYKKHGERFLKRLYTEGEIEYALKHDDPVPYLAARFAVKEASIKALNLKDFAELKMRDFEVSGRIFGKKELVLHGKARKIADEMGVTNCHLSISHTHLVSMAVVIFEGV